MKRALLFLIIPVFLFNNSLRELFKIPVLAAHFSEHSTKDPSLGLLDFLSMHYWGSDLDDNDQDRDMQLPFKKMSGNQVFQFYFAGEVRFTQETAVPSENDEKPGYTQDVNLTDPFLDGLFRPPRA